MPTHPLWSPYDPPSPADIEVARVHPAASTRAPVEVVAPDPAWAGWYTTVRDRIERALGERALAVEHVGSTAVPGLWAKPVIDVDLTVTDPADEAAWLPDLERAGFELRVREPDWEQHRMLRGAQPPTNLHVFGPEAREPRRHVLFRDWLVTHADDRERYASIKRQVAAQGFDDAMFYNNAKAWVVYDIYEKIFAADTEHHHDPRPRPDAPSASDGD